MGAAQGADGHPHVHGGHSEAGVMEEHLLHREVCGRRLAQEAGDHGRQVSS